MRIRIDCDGILADFVGAICEWAQSNFQSTGRVFSKENCTDWDILKAWGLEEYQQQLDDHCSEIGFGESLPILPGAHDFVSALRNFGEVVVVTSPYSAVPTWCHERIHWLSSNFSFQKRDVVFAKRKELVSGDVLIDDALHNCEAWSDAHPRGLSILLDSPWNRSHTPARVTRAHSYDEILQLVKYRHAALSSNWNLETEGGAE